ncbi:hypothetical protein D3C76_1048220 [compost metagenome]
MEMRGLDCVAVTLLESASLTCWRISMYTRPPGLIRGMTSSITPVCTYSTLLNVVSELVVLTVVWLMGILSPT